MVVSRLLFNRGIEIHISANANIDSLGENKFALAVCIFS
jgi:hypothetical protein